MPEERMPEDTDPLLQAVRDLLDALDPSDRDVVVDKLGSRVRLELAMVECARKVLALADQSGEPLPPGEYRRLAAATLTPSHAGVAHNPGHALDKYRRYLRRSTLPPEVLVAIGRVDEELIPPLVVTVRIRDRVLSIRGRAEPPFMITAVAAACVHGFSRDREGVSDDEITEAVIAVLNRGTALARDYERSGRPRAGQRLSPAACLGNASFLEQVAAWYVAIAERVGNTEHGSPIKPVDALEAVEEALPDIEHRLDMVTTRAPTRSWAKSDVAEEPDVVLAFGEVAAFLGAAAGDGATVTRKVVERLNPALRRLRLPRREPRMEPVDFSTHHPRTLGRTGHHDTSPQHDIVYIQHLVAWTIATFFDGVAVDDRETLLTWLVGDRPVDSQDYLLFLVCCLRVTLRQLRQIPDHPPTGIGLAEPDYRRLVKSLLPALTQAVADQGLDHPSRVVADALPPLWTRRRPAVELVTAHLQRFDSTHNGRAKAALVAAAGVYGPSQHLHRGKGELPRRCCWNRPAGANCAQPDTEPPRCFTPYEPHPATDPCRERPWSEVGVVENYTTLAEWARFKTPEAARRQLERYQRDNRPGSAMLTGN